MSVNTWDRADTADENSANEGFQRDYWGFVRMTAWDCALVKGQGKVPYDPTFHKSCVTAIDITVDLLPEHGTVNPYVFERQLVHFEREWFQFTKVSIQQVLQDAGIEPHIKNFPDHWVKYTLVPTGETYQKQDDKGNTVTRDKTAIQFLKIFQTEAQCRADYLTGNGNESTQPAPAATTPTQPTNGQEKANAFQFLRVIVQNAIQGQTDLQVIRNSVAANIAEYEIVSRHFTVDSPETLQLIMEAMKK